jgi:hypothetical protein
MTALSSATKADEGCALAMSVPTSEVVVVGVTEEGYLSSAARSHFPFSAAAAYVERQ